MKVMHLRASNFYGGPERQLHFHARLAKAQGIDITVSSFSEAEATPDFLNRIADDNIPIHTFAVKSAYDFSAISLVREKLVNEQFDILATHDYRSNFIASHAIKNINVYWLAFSRGFTAENYKIRFFNYLDKKIIKKAAHIVAVSHSQKKVLTDSGLLANQVSVVHNAIESSLFDSIPIVDIKKQFGFDEDCFVAVSAGRFSTEKGQRFLVEAAVEALKVNDRLRFVLFGDGPDYEMLKELVEKNNCADYIKMPGFESNLVEHLKTADLLINPSLSEGLPNIVLEAMAVGVVVLATSVGGHLELIDDKTNGYLVGSADSDALAEKIIELSKNKTAMAPVVAKAKNKIVEYFNFQKQNHELLKIYNKLMTKND